MKRISLFGADFEDSKKIVTNGDFALKAGLPNPIHIHLLDRLFRVFVAGPMFAVLILFVVFGFPNSLANSDDIRYISYEAAILISTIGRVLFPITVLCYSVFLLGIFCVFWPKKRMSSQLWIYFPYFISMTICALFSMVYLASAVAYDAYTLAGFWIQLIGGFILFFWIIVNSIRNLKRRLNDESPKPILETVLLIALGMMAILFPISLVYHLVNNLPVLWYFYLFGLLLIVCFIIGGYGVSLLIDVYIVQAYYILKYPLKYKEYLGISDREWYSKSYYKKLVKSGQLKERVNPENEEIKE